MNKHFSEVFVGVNIEFSESSKACSIEFLLVLLEFLGKRLSIPFLLFKSYSLALSFSRIFCVLVFLRNVDLVNVALEFDDPDTLNWLAISAKSC